MAYPTPKKEGSTSSPITGLSQLTAVMLETGRYSDLTIKCQGKVFRVHRAVVCLQSKPLAAHVDGQFLEAVTGEIDLVEDEPEIVEKMIKFLYERDYNQRDCPHDDDDEGTTSPARIAAKAEPGSMSLLLHTKMYIIADKYDIPALKDFAASQYKHCLSFYSPKINLGAELPASLKLMYEETPESDRSLKDIAMATVGLHIKELMEVPQFARMVKENGEIAFDMVKASFVEQPHTPSTQSTTGLKHHIFCPKCKADLGRRKIVEDFTRYCLTCGHVRLDS